MEDFEYEVIANNHCDIIQLKFYLRNKRYETHFSLDLLNDTDLSNNFLEYYKDLITRKNAERVLSYILNYHHDLSENIKFFNSEKYRKLCKNFFFDD